MWVEANPNASANHTRPEASLPGPVGRPDAMWQYLSIPNSAPAPTVLDRVRAGFAHCHDKDLYGCD